MIKNKSIYNFKETFFWFPSVTMETDPLYGQIVKNVRNLVRN